MTSEPPRTTENEYEQAAQQCDPMLKGAESSSVKCNNNNNDNNNNPPVVVFAHGASAPSTSHWMIRWRNLLAKALNAVEVVTFDYPYIYSGKKAPPRPETLVGFHSDIVRRVAAKYPEHPLILVGKSMGSKISCMVAAENDIEASAVVCLGYPLKATKGVICDEPLLQLTVPIMFVQGGNDAFCPLKLLQVVRNNLKAVNVLHVIENGDHSFQIAKKNLDMIGLTREKAEELAAEAIAVFVSQITKVWSCSCWFFLFLANRFWPVIDAIVGLIMVVHLFSRHLNTTGLPLLACLKGVLPQHVSRTEVCFDDNAAGEQNNQPIKSQPRYENFSIAKRNQPARNFRKRKSERILKNKLKISVFDKDGRGSTIDKPLCIDD